MISAGAAARGAGAFLPLSVLAFALTLIAAAADVRAGEPLYVIEQLVVAVNSAPDGSGDRVATLKSGDRVELLDRQGDEAQIQLANGSSGWVKASYLSSELPLERKLQDRTAEVEKLKQDLTRLQSQLAARTVPPASPIPPRPATTASAAEPSAESAAPVRSAAAVPSAAAAPAPESAQTAVRDPSSFMGSSDQAGQPPWVWILSCSAGALALGFVAGWRMLDRRIRRKYGGLKIY